MFQVRGIKGSCYDYSVEFSHGETGTACVILAGPRGCHPLDMQTKRARAVSRRNPLDTPNKEVGRKIALHRSLAKTGFSKANRRLFWEQYFIKQADNKPKECVLCGQSRPKA